MTRTTGVRRVLDDGAHGDDGPAAAVRADRSAALVRTVRRHPVVVGAVLAAAAVLVLVLVAVGGPGGGRPGMSVQLPGPATAQNGPPPAAAGTGAPATGFVPCSPARVTERPPC